MDTRFLITCEHGGNRIPAAYRGWFHESAAILATHRGYDPGALAMARDLARALHATLLVSATSRLLVDLNRSPGHPRLHGEMLKSAPAAVRHEILTRHYLPYRKHAERVIAAHVADGVRVVHVSSHSFTPVLDGEERSADIGLLYDPARPGEVALCMRWQAALAARAPKLRIRRNYPYRGTSDGFCTWLRRRFPSDRYVGIELEINQKMVGGARWRSLRQDLVATLSSALHATAPRRLQGEPHGEELA